MNILIKEGIIFIHRSLKNLLKSLYVPPAYDDVKINLNQKRKGFSDRL